MKKKIIASILFISGFISVYICLGYWPCAIKLEASPCEYFLASIRHMVLFKTFVSTAAGMTLGSIPYFFKSHRYIDGKL